MVSKVLPFYLVLGIVLICTLLFDRTVLKQVDYNLIFTFIFFFIFTGNLGKMNMIGHILEQGVTGRELTLGIFTSQFISNVPATLLLSSFTNHYKALLIGVNLGGLGTLIASMASLISYKLYAHNYNKSKGNYFLVFTLANVIMLLLLIFTHIVLTLL